MDVSLGKTTHTKNSYYYFYSIATFLGSVTVCVRVEFFAVFIQLKLLKQTSMMALAKC
jgi:hypothetical protein